VTQSTITSVKWQLLSYSKSSSKTPRVEERTSTSGPGRGQLKSLVRVDSSAERRYASLEKLASEFTLFAGGGKVTNLITLQVSSIAPPSAGTKLEKAISDAYAAVANRHPCYLLKTHLPMIERVISELGLPTPNLDMDMDRPELSWFSLSRDILLSISISHDERLWIHINRAGRCEDVKAPDEARLRGFLGELRA
jgi:hypothetical protein